MLKVFSKQVQTEILIDLGRSFCPLYLLSNELDYLFPNIWLQANPDHRWEIDEIRRAEREAKDV